VDYVVVAVLGVFVGASEIVSRYRDAPWRAVWNPAAGAYVAVNAAAAIAALSLTRSFGLTFGADTPGEVRTLQILIAGLSAVALLRTSVFVIRVGGRDIGVGPITLLQVLLFATDRDVDRRRAVERARIVSGALRDLSYSQARDALPKYCLTLMQNVSRDEEAELLHRVREVDEADMEDTLKANALGLVLMSIVGDKVLTAAAAAARSRIIQRGVLGEVYPRLREVLGAAGPGDAERRLDVLGITLHTAWPNIRQWLIDEPGLLAGWTIHLRVLDPDFLTSDASSWYDPRWAEEAGNVVSDVAAYNKDNADALSAAHVSLRVSTYRLVPAVHGFRTSDGSYFISIARWDATGKLGRPYQSYEYLPAGDDEGRTGQYKALFDNWLVRADASCPERDPGARSGAFEGNVVAVEKDGGDPVVGKQGGGDHVGTGSGELVVEVPGRQ
jgi:hypothetical protein